MGYSRRSFIKTTAAGAAVPFAVGTASADPADEPYEGIVSTRDHYDITWYNDAYRKDEYSRTEYDTQGTIPGLDGGSPEELIVFIHGWAHDEERAQTKFRQVTEALRQNGTESPVVGYSWDSDTDTLEWWPAVEIADLNADKFGTFVRDHRDASPDTTLRVIAHSLGAKTIAETVEFFMDREYDVSIDSIDLLGGAIGDDSVAMDGEYGEAIEYGCDNFRNYYKSDDETLGGQYELAMWNGAVGKYGIEGAAPENYTEIDVTYVNAHDDYPKPDVGCIPDVVRNWEYEI